MKRKSITKCTHNAEPMLCYIFCAYVLLLVFGCKKTLEVPPPISRITESNVYENDATAIAAVTGIYTKMSQATGSGSAGFVGSYSITSLCGLSSDEFQIYDAVNSTVLKDYYGNNLTANLTKPSGSEHWKPIYSLIFNCNAAIKGLQLANSLTPKVKHELQGEVLFLRAFLNFYLANLYGNAPLVLSTDYTVNSKVENSTTTEIYNQIIEDLRASIDLLSISFLDGTLSNTIERTRPTRWAALALLSRVYLYTKDYSQALIASSELINNNAIFKLEELNKVFLKNSSESIWQLQPISQFYNTEDARSFIIPSTGPNNNAPFRLNSLLINSAEALDKRFFDGNWIKKTTINGIQLYSPYKYKINLSDPNVTATSKMKEYTTVFRLAEQYLIRAEARIMLNDINGKSDIDSVRIRAGLDKVIAADRPSLLKAIIVERQHELFLEWGHRWFDLKRLEIIDSVMSSVTPLKTNGSIQWKSHQKIFPLPNDEINKNTNLKQNEGY